jgi:acetate kinase
MNILALNAGSATLKYKLFNVSTLKTTETSWALLVEGAQDFNAGDGMVAAANAVIEQCGNLGIDAIGHRFVHGGSRFIKPTLLSPEILDALRTLEPLDPLHNPTEIALVDAGLRLLPKVPAVAVFDTAFHHTLPEVAWRYAIPHELSDRLHLRKYGFHGTSHSYVSKELFRKLDRSAAGTRVVTCHLGSGSSICAIKDGMSVDTSMGLTPLEGLAMGTRSGDIDPGLILFLLQHERMNADGVNDLLNNKSGLLGLSESSNDVRKLEEATANGDKKAELALEIFAYRVAKYVGAYAAALDGLDAVALTGGIGEHSADVRMRICKRLKFLGIDINHQANASAVGSVSMDISKPAARVRTWVIPTNEELQLAKETAELLS